MSFYIFLHICRGVFQWNGWLPKPFSIECTHIRVTCKWLLLLWLLSGLELHTCMFFAFCHSLVAIAFHTFCRGWPQKAWFYGRLVASVLCLICLPSKSMEGRTKLKCSSNGLLGASAELLTDLPSCWHTLARLQKYSWNTCNGGVSCSPTQVCSQRATLSEMWSAQWFPLHLLIVIIFKKYEEVWFCLSLLNNILELQ